MNAAVDLAEMFQKWMKDSAKSVYDNRGEVANGGTTLGYWSEYQHVLELISDLDYALDILDSKGKSRARYDSMMLRVWQYAVLPEHGWHTRNNTSISPDVIDLLLTLGDVIETHVPQVNKMSAEGRELVLQLLADAGSAAQECSDLPPKIRTRLAVLIDHLSNLLDPENDANPRTVQRALDEMTSVLLRAVWAEKNPDKKFKLLHIAMSFAQTIAESGSYDILKSITSAPIKEMLGLPAHEDG